MLVNLDPSDNSGLVSGKEFLVLVGDSLGPLRPTPPSPWPNPTYVALRSCYLYYSFGLHHFIEWPDKTGLTIPEVHVLSGMMLETTSVPSFFKLKSVAISMVI